MAGPKFFIYGGCRWRELDITSGHVLGWGNVEFLTVQRGRLQVARKKSVLSGLKALADSKPTTVRDGPTLSQIRHQNAIESKKEEAAKCQHHCCCKQHDLRYNSDAIFNNLLKAATTTAAVQCSLTEVSAYSKPQPKATTISTVINYKRNQKKHVQKRKSRSDDEEDAFRSAKSRPNGNRNLLNTSTEKRSKNQLTSNKYDKTKLRNSSRITSSSDDEVEDVPLRRKSQRINKKDSSIEATDARNVVVNNRFRLRKSKTVSSSDDEIEEVPIKLRNLRKNHEIEKPIPRNTRNSKNRSYIKESNDNKRKLGSDDDSANISKLKKRKVKNDNHVHEPRQTQDDVCKELLIGEEDVMLLRTFIERSEVNVFNVDLERFDTDDTYKGRVFYKLNPLVNIVRCQKIAAMIREQRHSDSVSFEDFISNLGLRSILDSSSQASSSKYRMRPRPVREAVNSDSELDKENRKKSKVDPTRTSLTKVLSERGRDNKKNRVVSKKNVKVVKGLKGMMTSRPQREKVVSISSDSDSDSVFEKGRGEKRRESRRVTSDEKMAVVKRANVPVERVDAGPGGGASGKASGRASSKASGRASGKASGREYSRAEDEAVVSWVRGAGRARRVNGNQLWRELQPVHQEKTGQFRSWHSLRNRYLRYVLPALGALALPPGEAARLRADAAAGELKTKKRPQLRSPPPPGPPVRSAWSRRPRPPPRESPSSSPARSPTPPRARSSDLSSFASLPDNSDTSSSSPSSAAIDRRSSLRRKSTAGAASAAEKDNNKEKTPRKLRSSTSGPSAREPTYSELTRRFADDPAHAAHAHEHARTRARRRRLYNPNTT